MAKLILISGKAARVWAMWALLYSVYGNIRLEWGLINGQCRCVNCHAQYMMRAGDKIVDVPISQLKEEYKAPAKWAWENLNKREDNLTDADWDKSFKATSS